MGKYIYVVISRTPTFTGKMVRMLLKSKYNHASISLDENLSQMYSFCRFSITNPLIGGIVRESAFTLSLGLDEDVPIKVYRIPITTPKYKLVKKFIEDTYNDSERYYYNMLQAIGVIFNKKHALYKTYICSEFVIEALMHGGIKLTSAESYEITPSDICGIMGEYIFYPGNLKDYPFRQKVKTKDDELFFCKTGIVHEVMHTLVHFWRVMNRDRNRKKSSSRIRI
jgi:hypothetical protein